MIAETLQLFDLERQSSGERSPLGQIVRERTPDGSNCWIAYSNCTEANVDEVIRREISLADESGYSLEWKFYGHDGPPNLRERLLAHGFSAEPIESLMVIAVSQESLTAFVAPDCEVRRIQDAEGLLDVVAIGRDVGRENIEQEVSQNALTLQDSPHFMSMYVAYDHGEPVSYGRIYFPEHSKFAGLYGGNTKPSHRNRGFYTALVAARLGEALKRGYEFVTVDALPTSEPILRKRGFQFLTHTQPFVYSG